MTRSRSCTGFGGPVWPASFRFRETVFRVEGMAHRSIRFCSGISPFGGYARACEIGPCSRSAGERCPEDGGNPVDLVGLESVEKGQREGAPAGRLGDRQ